MIPTWLHLFSIASLLLGTLCLADVAADVARHPQHMEIMNVVWPVPALFGTLWAIWQYACYDRLAPDRVARWIAARPCPAWRR